MKNKKLYAVLLSLLSFFSTFANIFNTAFAQGAPMVQVAYCTDGILYQGKYKFWIVASPNLPPPFHASIPFHLENGQIENVANIYSSSISVPIGVEDGVIEISGQAVTSLTISGSSPMLTLNPGMTYAVIPVTHCEDLISAVLSGTLIAIGGNLKSVEDAQNKFNSIIENAPLVLQGTGFDFDILKQLTELSYVAPLIIGGVIASQQEIPSVVGTKHWWECIANLNDIQISQLSRDQWPSKLSEIGFTDKEIPVVTHILEMTQRDIARVALLDNYHEATALSLANNAVNEVRQIVPQHVSADEFARELAAIDKRSGVKVLENVHVKPLVEETVQSAHEYVINPTSENLQTYTNLATQAARENINDAVNVADNAAQQGIVTTSVEAQITQTATQAASLQPVQAVSQTFFLNNYYNLISSTDTVSFVSIRGNTIWTLSPTTATIPGVGEQGNFAYLAPRIADAWANGQIDGIIPAAADTIDDITLQNWNSQLKGIIEANYADKLSEFNSIGGIIRTKVMFLYTTDTSGLPIIKAVNTKTGEAIATPQIPEAYLSKIKQGADDIENKINGPNGLKTDASFQQNLDGAKKSAQQLGNEEVLQGVEKLEFEFLSPRPELNLQAVANAWKTEKISGVVKYLDSWYKGFAADYAGAIKTATRVFFVVYIALTVALALNLVPKEWVPLLMTVHTILSWGFTLFTLAGVVWPGIVALAEGEGLIKAGGIVLTGAVHTFLPMIVISMGMIYATWWLGSQCTGQITVQPSKSTAQQGETIKLRISGFSGSGCSQKPVYLFNGDPNAQGATPQSLFTSSNPAGVDLDFTLPTTTGTYIYYIATRIETNRAYANNELEAVIANCPSNSQQCMISVGTAGQQPSGGQPSGGTTTPVPCRTGYTCYGASGQDCSTYCGSNNVEGSETVTTPCNEAGNKGCCKCTTPPATGQCSGQPVLSLSSNSVQQLTDVTTTISGLASCKDKTVYVKKESCTGAEQCHCSILSSSDSGCSCTFKTPSLEGIYSYVACIDKNSDNDFGDAEEYSQPVQLTVSTSAALPFCTMTPATTTVTGKQSVTFTANIQKEILFGNRVITEVFATCDNNLYFVIPIQNSQVTFSCNYRPTDTARAFQPRVWAKSGDAPVGTEACTSQVTVSPSPDMIPGELRKQGTLSKDISTVEFTISRGTYPVSGVTADLYTTDLYIGTSTSDSQGEIRFTIPFTNIYTDNYQIYLYYSLPSAPTCSLIATPSSGTGDFTSNLEATFTNLPSTVTTATIKCKESDTGQLISISNNKAPASCAYSKVQTQTTYTDTATAGEAQCSTTIIHNPSGGGNGNGIIYGRVTDSSTGQGLSGVSINILEIDYLAWSTDSQGYYQINNVPPSGNLYYRVRAYRQDYGEVIGSVKIAAGESKEVNLALSKAPSAGDARFHTSVMCCGIGISAQITIKACDKICHWSIGMSQEVCEPCPVLATITSGDTVTLPAGYYNWLIEPPSGSFCDSKEFYSVGGGPGEVMGPGFTLTPKSSSGENKVKLSFYSVPNSGLYPTELDKGHSINFGVSAFNVGGGSFSTTLHLTVNGITVNKGPGPTLNPPPACSIQGTGWSVTIGTVDNSAISMPDHDVTYTITADYGENILEGTIKCSTPATKLISVSPSQTTINMGQSTIITATTSDTKKDVTVSFGTGLGGFSPLPYCKTDNTGSCSVSFSSNHMGTAAITASATGYNYGTTTVNIVETTPSISLSASPTSIYVDGISTVTATTSDNKPSVTISFTSTLSGLSATTCTTDNTGSCSVTFTPDDLGTATITASAAGYTSKSVYITVKTPTSGGPQPLGMFEGIWQILKSIFGIK